MKKSYNILGKNMKIDELGLYISSLIFILGSFMPYYTISVFGASQSINFLSGDGKMALVVIIGACACMWFNKYIFSLGLSIATIAIVLINFSSDYSIADGVGKHDFGAYICLFSSVVMVICCMLSYFRNKNGNESIEKGFSNIAKKTKEATSTIISKASDISVTKNEVTCPKCNKHYLNEMNFCPDCGTPKPIVDKKICTKCDSELEINAKFCPKCGEEVIETTIKSSKVCKNCGADLKEGTTFCGKCGDKVEE